MVFLKLRRLFASSSLPAWNECVQLKWTDLRTYVLVTISAAIVLALRQPSTLLDPQFVFEDGAVFFAQAYNLNPIEALTQIYAGYWHTVPRIVAETGKLLPPQWAPFYYSWFALLLAAGAISWLILPLHESIIGGSWLRLAVILLIVLTPRLDGLMLIAYVQWFVAFWAVLVTLAPAPSQQWLRWTIAAAYTLVSFTAPALIVLAPIWLLRWWNSGPGLRRWNGYLGLVTLLSALLVLMIRRPPSISDGNLVIAILDTVRGVSYRSFTLTVLGATLGNDLILHVGWWNRSPLSAARGVLWIPLCR